MGRFCRMLSFAALVAVGSATFLPRDDPTTPSACKNGAVVSNTTVSASGNDIQVTTFSCNTLAPEADFTISIGGIIIIIPWFPPLPPRPPKHTSSVVVSSTSSAPAAAPTADVCNELCTNTCGSIGDLPPISEDCQTIFDSITIMQGSEPPTFTVESNHIQQLTFGTCRVFFENFSNETVSECWTTLSSAASAAGTQCFPPTQPVNSAGFCSPSDAAWQIGIAHS